jgi:hypothetical protein
MYTIARANLHHVQKTIERIKTHDTYLSDWNLELGTLYDKSQ